MILSTKTHRIIYIASLSAVAVFLSFPHFLISLSQFILVFNWIFEGDINAKINRLKANKPALVFLLLYGLHLFGLLYTSNFNYALIDLRVKLPLLVLPFIIASSAPITFKEFRIIITLFVASVSIATFIDISTYWFLSKDAYIDIRQISIFVSHIRFSLLILISISALFIMSFGIYGKQMTVTAKVLSVIIMIWFTIFLFIIQSVTGFVILTIGIILTEAYYAFRTKKKKKKMLLFFFLIILLGSPFYYLYIQVRVFYTPTTEEELKETTSEGNFYTHDPSSYLLENGNKVWINVCESELRESWNRVSTIQFDSLDRGGFPIKFTLIRYLSSLGYFKDAQAVKNLTESDISNVEQSIANYRFSKQKTLNDRIYQIIWELHNYFHGGNPSGHSVAQRLEYVKIAGFIIQDNFWFGVGTGDIPDAFKEYYESTHSKIKTQWRRRTHNQYISLFATFGFFGFIIAMASMFLPIFLNRKRINFFFISFSVIAFLSMLNEDTIETQVGVTLFAFFYSLYMFGYISDKKLS